MSPDMIRGVVLATGWGEGTLCFVKLAEKPGAASAPAREPAMEIDRFEQQVTALLGELEVAAAELEQEDLASEVQILRTHLLMLQDPQFHRDVGDTIRHSGFAAEVAVDNVLGETAAALHGADDAVLAERARDLEDLAGQLRAKLSGEQRDRLADQVAGIDEPVLALPELLPSLVLEARRTGVRGFVVERGTEMSHAAILARSFGLPVLRVPELELVRAHEGRRVHLDGARGELLIDPDKEQAVQMAQDPVPRPAIAASADLPARLWLSIVDPAQLENLDWTGVRGIGLYRTEVLFMQYADFPTEQEQISVYARVFEHAGDRPVTVRTLDLGGDKMLDYLNLGPQANPYLGLRAHRLYRYHPELLIRQVRAILRAARGRRLRLLFPMIEHLEAWQEVQQLVRQAIGSLHAEGVGYQDQFEQGLLVETPSAAWGFPRLLEQADFTSVGTNDLVQYLFAVERGSSNVAHLYQPEHPIVLQLLQQLAEQAKAAGKELSICGEIASDLRFVPLLIGLGLEDLTVSPAVLPQVLAHLHTLGPAACREMARTSAAAADAAAVRTVLGRRSGEAAQETATEAIDPICGMAVQREGNPHVIERQGRRYHFCSPRCMSIFRSQHLQEQPVARNIPPTSGDHK